MSSEDRPLGMTSHSVVAVQFDSKGVWRLWCAVGLLLAIYAVALLEGFQFLPYIRGFLGYVGVAPLLLGGVVEQWLMVRRGQWFVSERLPLGPMSRVLSRGSLYVVPPIAASAGRFMSWEAWVAVAFAVVLAIRFVFLWRRPARTAESYPPTAL